MHTYHTYIHALWRLIKERPTKRIPIKAHLQRAALTSQRADSMVRMYAYKYIHTYTHTPEADQTAHAARSPYAPEG